MTSMLAALHLLTAAKKTSAGSPIFLFLLVGAGIAFYFLLYKPQQRKAAAARGAQGSGFEVGDEVQTIGGVIGTILEISGDRYTLITGSLGEDGNLDGPQPTRIVFIRQAIARKVDPVVEADVEDDDTDVDDNDVEDIDAHVEDDDTDIADADADADTDSDTDTVEEAEET